MPGFREYAPGQVWFYFNANATKALEQKKELGSCTSRPVVIIQNAFYPEWNDMVTVCPMTSSDRRSGVYIDTTILKDGSVIEGGTVLPYLFYNIRTKYLFPIIASNHKRKLITLSPEDFAKVRHGYEYHFGMRQDPPDYVENWKHLDDFDRNIVLQDVRLAVNNWEEALLDHHSTYLGAKKGKPNPILKQEDASSPIVENHILASMNVIDRDAKRLCQENSFFNESSIKDMAEKEEHEDVPKETSKPLTKKETIIFTQMSTLAFSEELKERVGGYFPVSDESQLYPGSQVLNGVSLKDMAALLSDRDLLTLLNMTISDIMANTGISSTSTASRFRRELRSLDWNGYIQYDDTNNVAIYTQNDVPENFHYDCTYSINKPRVKKAAKRRKAIFSKSKEELKSLMALSNTDLALKLSLPLSYGSAARTDIIALYPDLVNITPAADKPTEQTSSQEQSQTNVSYIRKSIMSLNLEEIESQLTEAIGDIAQKYYYWQTLARDEIIEVKTSSKKHINNLAHNFGINRDRARVLRNSVLNLSRRGEDYPIINPCTAEESCLKVLEANFDHITLDDLLTFTRTDSEDITRFFSQLKLATNPGRSGIRKIKSVVRKVIAQP